MELVSSIFSTVQRSIQGRTLVETGGSAVAAVALVWLSFTVAGITGPLGFGVCCLVGFFVLYGVLCWLLHGVLAMKDRLATLAIWSGALIAFVPLIAVIYYVVYKGLPVVAANFPSFFVKDFSGYTATAPVTAVGAGAAIVGTIEQVGLATLFTVPLGILTATYLVNFRNTLSRVSSSVVDAMTGSPAIIAGLFVYLLWVKPQKESGQTGFAAALALSVMMLPIIVRSTEETLKLLPDSLKEAGLALGLPFHRVIFKVIVPVGVGGILSGVMLSIARITGETAPLLFTAFGNPYLSVSLTKPMQSLPLLIYNYATSPYTDWLNLAWGASVVLLLWVLFLNIFTKIITRKWKVQL